MKNTKRTVCSFLAAACLCASPLVAQDLSDQTLNFNNITGTNINQTVAESSQGNEKEVEFGDYDNDGDYDIVIAVGESDFGERRNKLYRNDGGVLNEVSGAPVIPGFSFTDTSRSAFFRDYNGDGRLDIIIVNDSNSGTATNDSAGKTKLFLQNASGVFVNTSQNLANQTGAACNGISVDFDGNGLDDLVMCNYPNISQDSMTLNGINGDAPGDFTLVTNTNYPAEGFYGVHSEAGDMNGDGKIDILMANWTGSPSYIYYNNNMGGGSADGDFRYGGAAANTSFGGIGGSDERAMVPVDINGDGMLDMYFANRGGGTSSRSDFLFINQGNDANNKATFSQIQMPTAHDQETHKITCNDLDNDGTQDLIVMSEFRRPYIYRNLSTETDVKMIEWTPGNIGIALEGWQAKSIDLTGNERADIFFGSDDEDHLFENVAPSTVDFDSLPGGVVPTFHNGAPAAISGTIAAGETKTFIIIGGAAGTPAGSSFSTVVHAEGDVDLSVAGAVNGTSARTGDVAEGIQGTMGTGNLVVTLTGVSGGILLGDLNGDGAFNLLDVDPFIALLAGSDFNAAADFNGDGAINLLDVQGFVDGLANGSGSGDIPFVIEFLSRS